MIDLKLLKDRVQSNCTFVYAQGGDLYYLVVNGSYLFKIPYADTVDSGGSHPEFKALEKGIILMRWIKKQMELDQAIQEEAQLAKDNLAEQLIEDWGHVPPGGLEGEEHAKWLEQLGRDDE